MKSLTLLILLASATVLAAAPIEVELVVDPVGSKNRMVTCSVINNSKRPIKAKEGCDGVRNVLLSPLKYPLAARPVYEMEFEEVVIPPGQKRPIFEVYLEEVLLLTKPAHDQVSYRWSWHQITPKEIAPLSPIHPDSGEGSKTRRLDAGVFRAEVEVNGKVISSPEVPFSLKKKRS